jgi:hypothetical protein
MICCAKPGLTEDLYKVQKEKFSITWYMCETYTSKRRSLFVREKPILSSERVLYKDCDSKGSDKKKKTGRDSQGAWRRDELIGIKAQSVK